MAKNWEKKIMTDYERVGKTLIFQTSLFLLDANTSGELKRDIMIAAHNSRFRNIILVLSSVEQYNHDGLSAVQYAARHVNLKGGKCILVDLNEEAKKTFQKLGCDSWFIYEDSLEKAKAQVHEENKNHQNENIPKKVNKSQDMPQNKKKKEN